MSRHRTRTGVAFAGPSLVGFFLLALGPMLASAAISLCRWDGLSGQVEYIGAAHYRAIFGVEPGSTVTPHDP